MSARSIFSGWVLVLLLMGGIYVAGNAGAQLQPASAEAAITTQVRQVLASDEHLKRMHITVDTQGSVVELTGFVSSMEAIARAGKLARAVSGVSAVRNRLQVANRPTLA